MDAGMKLVANRRTVTHLSHCNDISDAHEHQHPWPQANGRAQFESVLGYVQNPDCEPLSHEWVQYPHGTRVVRWDARLAALFDSGIGAGLGRNPLQEGYGFR